MRTVPLLAGAAALSVATILWWLLSPAPMMNIGFAAYGGHPVVVKAFILNTQRSSLFAEMVVDGGGEAPPRTSGAGNHLVSYRKGWSGDILIDIIWVELSTGKAWQAAANVSADRMTRSASGAIQLMPILAPGGLLILSSDPIPDSAQDQRVNDLARICGTRVPELDQDYSSDPRALPGLWEALQTIDHSPYSSACKR